MDERIHDAFDSVRATDELKSSALEYLCAERERRSKHTGATFRRVAAVCAILAVFVCIGGYYALSVTPVSYISIDVNPSIELTLNRWDRVISATAYNDEGTQILNRTSVKGMKYTDAINTIVDSEAMQPYLTGDGALTFTIASDSTEKERQIRTGIENCSGCRKHSGQSYSSKTAVIDEAHGNGLSFGKYSAYLILAEYSDTVSLDDCRSMTMAELYEHIDKHRKGECHESHEDDRNQENEKTSYEESNGDQNENNCRDDRENSGGHGSGHHNGQR